MACYLLNRSSQVSLDAKVTEEVWTSNPINFNNLRIFGCPALCIYPVIRYLNLIQSKKKKCVFVGYSKGVMWFKFWDPFSKKMVISRDVVFDEQSMLPEIVDTTMPMSDGASPRSLEVQVDLEQLLVILGRTEPCIPRPEVTPHLSLDL